MEFRLDIGSLAEKIEVRASAPLINTENAEKCDVMVTQEIVERCRSTAAISPTCVCSRRER
jgi:hypothetical protein